MTPPPAPTPAPKPEVPLDQILELLSEHIASNDRVTDAVGRFETKFPQESERILAEHRRQMPEPTVCAPIVPTEPTQIQRSTVNLLNLWGVVIVMLIIGCSCTLLYFQLSR